MKRVLVTGSGGLVGSEAVEAYCQKGWRVVGIDNNMRADFFGPRGDTTWNTKRLVEAHPGFEALDLDIRDRGGIRDVIARVRPHLIIHSASQPSHDLAAQRAFDDFEVNAVGTLNLLEAVRHESPESVFVLLSTNKVYGDTPNTLPMTEKETRWDFARPKDRGGIDESCSVDQSMHSLFGVSKTAADLLTQAYGRYFGIATVSFRGGCLTGPNHSGVELHGFLSYLFKVACTGGTYTIFGYKGKQVRDNIHSYDVIRAIDYFFENPRPGEVYNLGGGRGNSCSILEAIAAAEARTGRKMNVKYSDEARKGDHICYITNLTKFREHYTGWSVTRSLELIYDEIFAAWSGEGVR